MMPCFLHGMAAFLPPHAPAAHRAFQQGCHSWQLCLLRPLCITHIARQDGMLTLPSHGCRQQESTPVTRNGERQISFGWCWGDVNPELRSLWPRTLGFTSPQHHPGKERAWSVSLHLRCHRGGFLLCAPPGPAMRSGLSGMPSWRAHVCMQRGPEGQSTMSDIPARTTLEAGAGVWRKRKGCHAMKETAVMSSPAQGLGPPGGVLL